MIVSSLVQAGRNGLELFAHNDVGATLSRAVAMAGPSCANVSSMFVRAPENDVNFGADTTLNNAEVERHFSEAYERTHKAPLFDHDNYYRGNLRRNFRPTTYVQPVLDFPCVIVRTRRPLDQETSFGLFVFKPDHCTVEDIEVYTIGIACVAVQNAYRQLRKG
jgi:hypothetical protein